MRIKAIVAVLLAGMATCAFAQIPEPKVPGLQPLYELPPVLRASEILEPSLLRGAHHQILEPVGTEGLLNQYTIQSDFGVFRAEGNDML